MKQVDQLVKEKTSLGPLLFETYEGQASKIVARQMALWVWSSGKAT